MNSFWFKFLIIAMIFVAESASIYSEILSAKQFDGSQASFWRTFIKLTIFTFIFATLIMVGYMFGQKTFKNIWIVSVISITSILIAEPILAWYIFKQLPTKGSVIGLALGALGFMATLFIK